MATVITYQSVLNALFNPAINQNSPVVPCIERVSKFDENGKEVVSFEDQDLFSSVVLSHGKFSDWSINSLMKAGISPDFPIRTGPVSRVESAKDIESISSAVEKMFAEPINVEPSKTE